MKYFLLIFSLILLPITVLANNESDFDLTPYEGKVGKLTIDQDGDVRTSDEFNAQYACTVKKDTEDTDMRRIVIEFEPPENAAMAIWWATFSYDDRYPYTIDKDDDVIEFKSSYDPGYGRLLCGWNAGNTKWTKSTLTLSPKLALLRIRFWCLPMSEEPLGKHVYNVKCEFDN